MSNPSAGRIDSYDAETPYIYQGEEIGMTNPGYGSISQYRDESTNMYDIMVNHNGMKSDDMMAIAAQKSRDNSELQCNGMMKIRWFFQG